MGNPGGGRTGDSGPLARGGSEWRKEEVVGGIGGGLEGEERRGVRTGEGLDGGGSAEDWG